MSSTRYAPQGSPISYERYMSSPEFAELRGIPGTAVAAKAQLYSDARKRSLLFFLQSLSIKEGGLRRVAQILSERLATYSEEELADLLIEFCINPKIVIRFSDEPSAKQSPLPLLNIKIANELREFQNRYEADIKSNFVFTTIGREVFETLNHALAIGKWWC